MTNCFNLKLTGAAVALALAGIAGSAAAATPGYVSSSSGQVWTSPYGMCWRTTDWTPEKAAAPCDVVPVAQVAPPPVAVAPPPPVAAAPTPPPPPVIEQISLSNDVLWYHADYVAPSWGRRLTRVDKIGAHIFYRS